MKKDLTIDYWQKEIDENRGDAQNLYIIALQVLSFAAERSLEFKPLRKDKP